MFTKPKREIDRVFLHCSASSRPEHGKVSVIREWHKARGWSDIGYHYFIPFEGDLQVGRDIEKTPAAQKGHNTGTIAICLHGLHKHDFTLNQFETLMKLCKEINGAYKGNVTFHGHCEVSAKACPVFDYNIILKLHDGGHMSRKVKPKILDMFDTGIEIMNLQKQLNLFFKEFGKKVSMLAIIDGEPEHIELNSYVVEVDGIFGQQTAQAVLFFQMKNGLTPCGTVGSKTRLLLPNLEG